MEDDLYQALLTLGHPVAWLAFNKAVGLPRISLQRISTVTGYSQTGRADVETARVQINVSAETYPEAAALGRAVSELLTELRSGSVIRCRELSRRDGSSETGGDIIRQQMLDISVRYRA
ncbi:MULTISPECIES: tail completion protein gp17 [Phaeobacter]|uniref:tail completion protein gp17 n=1 Tax=Phaeobacter TaxID=302485 RepID=UPI0021A4B9BD|nr:DUF3168 domain-containing protein [Phaeobacter inhibens]UWR89202.1 DUF3168 domain-containing protein [Phaeobacter inhibens]